MRFIFNKEKIPNVMWQKASEGKSYQITFSLQTGNKCDDVIHLLSEYGIGKREGSSITIIPCALFYDPIVEHEEEEVIEDK